MPSPAPSNPPRLLSPAEVGGRIRRLLELRHWSKEQLAEISGLNVVYYYT